MAFLCLVIGDFEIYAYLNKGVIIKKIGNSVAQVKAINQLRTEEIQHQFEALCDKKSIRLTPQRRSVYEILAMDKSHPTADNLYERLHQDMPSLSRATVYRILESFVTKGIIRKVSSATGVIRFDANIHQHQHLVCRSCGKMIDIEEPSLMRIQKPDEIINEFIIEDLDIQLIGLCKACRA